MVTTDDEELAWLARSFRDHGYDVKERLNLLELEQKLPYIHTMVGWNYRMTEMQSVIGLAELDRIDTWNLPTRRRNAYIILGALRDLPRCNTCRSTPWNAEMAGMCWHVHWISKICPVILTNSSKLPGLKGFPAGESSGRNVIPNRRFNSITHLAKWVSVHKYEYAQPESVDYSNVEVPNAVWHQAHTFTCFAYPTFSDDDCHQISDGLVKVIRAYSQ